VVDISGHKYPVMSLMFAKRISRRHSLCVMAYMWLSECWFMCAGLDCRSRLRHGSQNTTIWCYLVFVARYNVKFTGCITPLRTRCLCRTPSQVVPVHFPELFRSLRRLSNEIHLSVKVEENLK